MITQGDWWGLAGAAALMAVAAALFDWRRNKRPDLDQVGWVPWALVQILAMIGAVVAAVLALRG